MSKKVVITLSYPFHDDGVPEEFEYEGDVDAQLHNNGCLIVVEYSPNIQAGDGSKKAELIAMYNSNEWAKVEVK